MTTAILGYASGVAAHRVTIPGIALVVFVFVLLQSLAAGLPADATTARARTNKGLIGYATSVITRLTDLTARAG